MLLLHAMNINLKFSIGILFALTILICMGINTYSNSCNRSYNVHLSSHSNSCCNNLSADIDSGDDDQIFHRIEINSFTKFRYQKTITRNCFSTQNFFLTIWQPPKFSLDIL